MTFLEFLPLLICVVLVIVLLIIFACKAPDTKEGIEDLRKWFWSSPVRYFFIPFLFVISIVSGTAVPIAGPDMPEGRRLRPTEVVIISTISAFYLATIVYFSL